MKEDSGCNKTAAEYYILCPTRPGGSVNSWLSLTATNRASQGVEAFVAYHGQDPLRFVVFDWAREERWQVDMQFTALGPYLHEIELYHGTFQTVHVQSFTYLSGAGRWSNRVYLRNGITGDTDLIYAYDYPSTGQDQKAGWNGSWGPIVETFQNLYQGTNEVGFAFFSVASRGNGEWDPWEELSPVQSYVRQDGVGFRIIHLEPNYTFIAGS